MNAWEAVRTSLAEILSHKLRSALTLVGVVLGTTSLVVMVSVIGGVAVAVQKGLGDLGYDGVMVVQAQAPAERLERKKQGYSRGLRAADLRAIEAGREVVSAAAPVVGFRERALLNGRALEVNGEGVTAEYGRIRYGEVGRGRLAVKLRLAGTGKVESVSVKAPASLDVWGIVPCARKAVYDHRFPTFDGPSVGVDFAVDID